MSVSYKRSICWVRRDLRLFDHTALAEATYRSHEVFVVFVFDPTILDLLEDRAHLRVSFIHRSLQEMDRKLREQGSRLWVLLGNPATVIPQFAKEIQAEAVFASRDYEPFARRRDLTVQENLKLAGIEFLDFKDQITFDPHELATAEGNPFRVFTPFRKAWEKLFIADRDAAEAVSDLNKLARDDESIDYPMPSLENLGFQEVELWLEPGEDAGRKRLANFASKLADYKAKRDFPALDQTSTLSVDFRFGTVSIREAIRLTLEHPSEGADSWRSELIWREFYQHILFHYPDVVDQTFQPQYRDIEYPGSKEDFEAWSEGRTGFPIVDAAMRCLNATGWMHNRLRMVVASFLTKDLLVDYRWGEAYFQRKLLDFDLASNNGGWQWSASTGADPQPYFRIFNPISQSAKFDSEGNFIRRWVPELADLEAPSIYFPALAAEFDLLTASVELGKTYPHPIVDHAIQRDRAIALLSKKPITES